MTDKEYRQHEGVSRSQLWKLRESPEKAKYAWEHPEPPTPALLFGQAVHKLILEPDTFDDEFAVAPNIDRRTKDGKTAYNAFCESLGDRQVITLEQYETAVEMRNKAISEPFVVKLLNCDHETPFIWTDVLTNEVVKIRLDGIGYLNDTPFVIEYKTTEDASTDGFIRSAIKYGYDFQAAMACEAVEIVTGKKPIFVFIAQEKKPPYSVNILQADKLFIQRGYEIYRELIGIYHDCKKSGNWYGYLGAYNIINNLALPSWAAKELEQ